MTAGDRPGTAPGPSPARHPSARPPAGGDPSGRRASRRRAPRPVSVACAGGTGRPLAVTLGRRRLAVDEVLDVWVVETGWWRDEGPVRQVVWRVRAGGRLLDLCRDRRTGAWTLARVLA